MKSIGARRGCRACTYVQYRAARAYMHIGFAAQYTVYPVPVCLYPARPGPRSRSTVLRILIRVDFRIKSVDPLCLMRNSFKYIAVSFIHVLRVCNHMILPYTQ